MKGHAFNKGISNEGRIDQYEPASSFLFLSICWWLNCRLQTSTVFGSTGYPVVYNFLFAVEMHVCRTAGHPLVVVCHVIFEQLLSNRSTFPFAHTTIQEHPWLLYSTGTSCGLLWPLMYFRWKVIWQHLTSTRNSESFE